MQGQIIILVGAMYLNSDISDKAVEKGADTDGFVISAAYKGAKAAKQGTWGLWGNYYDQGAGTFIAHTMKAGDWGYFTKEGFKGYGVGINYTLAKNMITMIWKVKKADVILRLFGIVYR